MSLWTRFIDLFRRRPAPPPTPPVPTGNLLAAVNVERQRNGLSALVEDARLTAAAQGHAAHMARTGVMSHDGWLERLYGAGYRNGRENVAEGQRSVSEAVAWWLASPGHRAAMLGPWTHAGAGNAGVYWCLIVAS